ncbi:MAG: glycogen synthase [Pseudomonadota bacterium]|jgi:glycogen/starch synthases, ADP-glucose type|nr:MAG: glycogen synthase [Pseudomonadota bacterium]
MPLRVCFITAEIAPLAKSGGLADVSSALTRHLSRAGHDVRVFTPGYSFIDRSKLEVHPVEFLQDVPLEVGPHRYRCSVSTVRLPGSSASVHLIECPELYARPSLYTTDADEHLRFLALTRAAFECCQRMAWSPQILHCNDWHAAFGPLFLRTLYAWDRLFHGTRSVLTIHNIGYQGVFGADSIDDLGLGPDSYLLHQDDLRAGKINSLRHGILYADAITTVSPTHAREICTPQYGMGLDHDLRARGDALVGILNGVDYDEWDPRCDRHLPLHYGPQNLDPKRELKRRLLDRFGLRGGERTPLAGIVSRLTLQKGIELLFGALPQVLARRDLLLIALGSGEPKYEEFFARLQRDFPFRVVFQRGYDEPLAHWIEAASDMFIMPSLYEPCGLNQMYSLRYGTVPIVRRTGGLADTVQHYDPATRQGTGIVFNDFDTPAMIWALETALDLYAQPLHWTRMMLNGMAQDFSWDRQTAQYVALYERLLGG